MTKQISTPKHDVPNVLDFPDSPLLSPVPFSLERKRDAQLFTFTPDELNIIEYCLAYYARYFVDNDDFDSVDALLDKVQSFTLCLGTLIDE